VARFAETTIVGDVPTLSVIIPVRDRSEALSRLLDRFAKLTSACSDDVEVIVVDDGSRETVVLPRYAGNVRLVHQRPKGANAARGAGLKLARGCYVHFHDSDDDFEDNWFAEILPLLREGHADVLLMGRKELLPDGTVRIRISRFAQLHAQNPALIGSRLRYENALGPFGGVVFRRSILVPIQFRHLHSCQDWQVYGSLPWSTLCVVVIDAPLLISDKRGSDRISRSIRRRALGHLQLARYWRLTNLERKRVRLFYLWRLRRDLKNGATRHERQLWRIARHRATVLGIQWELRLLVQRQIALISKIGYVGRSGGLSAHNAISPNA